jgi:hypothetical protein
MAVIEQFPPGAGDAVLYERTVFETLDERAARAALRAQIARLERELSAVALDACPRLDPGPPLPSLAGPRLLSLGELERVRDGLAARLCALHGAVEAQGAQQAQTRALLERMLADPPAHKWLRISNEQLGEPGCRHFHVRPRFGVVGMLMDWWRVKISSGCPLPWGP